MFFLSKYNSCKRWSIKGPYLMMAVIVASVLTADAQNLNNPNKPGPLGIQVNTLSGNVFIPRTDIYIPARSFDLDITFYYNSFLFNRDYGYGKGWTFLYNMRCGTDTVPGRKVILWGDGREDNYDSIPGGGYKSPRGFFTTLVQYQPGKYVLTKTDSTQYFFDNSTHKRLTKMLEPNGNYINFHYTDSLLTSMTNAAGQSITFTYNSNKRLSAVVDAIAIPQRTYTYTYDVMGNLVEVKDPLDGKCKYGYLVNGPMKSLTDKNNNKVDIIYFPDFSVRELIGCNKRLSFSYDTAQQRSVVVDHLPGGNQVTTYTYETLDNLAWITSMKGNCCGFNLNYEYDDQGNAIKMTDANGQVYSYTYDNAGNVLSITDPLNQVTLYTYTANLKKLSSYKDPKGNLYTLSYDNNGNLTQIVTPENNIYTATYNSNGDIVTSTDPGGNTFTYNYDAYGNPVTVTGPNGYHAVLAYDARGNLLSLTDARGNQSTAEYDILSRLKKIVDPYNNNIQLGYDAQGNLTTYTNKNSEINTLSYDAGNRIVKITNPVNKQTDFSYDGMDNLLSVKNPMGYITKFSYDTRNRMTALKDAENNNTIYSYDGNGNILTALKPNGQLLTYMYDALNRLTQVKDATSTIAVLSYDANGNVTSYTNATGAVTTAVYDSLDRIKKMTDPLGNTTAYTYDKNNNILSVTDREGHTSTYTYDSLNRVKTRTDNNNNTVTLSYDAAGNIVQVKDENNNITTYTYDSLNRRKRMIFPDNKYREFGYDKKNNITSNRLTDGTIITYQYDTLNRLLSRTLPDGEVYSYSYDDMGRILSATNSNGTAVFAYDALNRVISETFDGRTTRYTYNTSGRTQTVIYPDSATIVKEFDTRSRLTKIVKDGMVVAEYNYNNADQLAGKKLGNGVSSTMEYDFANRLGSLTTSNNIQNSSFTYDKERNKRAINRLNDPALSEQFSYDDDYRLTNYKRGPVGTPVLQNSYTYDAVGNRVSANLNGNATNYTTNSLNQLTTVNSTTFTYDDRGNLTFDGTFYKFYDAENRLRKDSASPSSVITYGYDALGRRVIKNINGTTLKYTYSGASQIEERNSSNVLLNRTVFSDHLSPVMNEKNGNKFYYHTNEILSVEAISNSSGRLIESYRYDAFGAPSRFDSLGNPISSSIAGNRFGFTGQEYDSASGSYRFFYRNYSPATGVFNQRDLIEYEDGMGMYQYVGNNPANGIDIWGLEVYDPKYDPPKPDCPQGASSWMSLWDFTANNKQVWDIFTMGSADVPVFKELMDVAAPFIDSYKTSESIKGFSQAQNGWDQAMHGGDAIKSGTGVVTGVGGMVSGGMGMSSVSSSFGGYGAGFFIWDLETQAIGKYGIEAPIEFEAMAETREAREYMWQQGKDDQEKIDRIRKLGQLEEALRLREHIYSHPCYEGGPKLKFKLVWDPVSRTWHLIPIDPNEIIGPDGEPNKAWVSVNDRLPYTINFENDTAATAPAKYIRITTPIEPKQEPSTFELGSFGFNYQSFDIPAGNASWYQRLDCRDSMNLYVDVVAGYDPINHQAFWEFQSIDPITLLPSEEPLAGLLFLQDTTKPEYGKGFVNFSIKPKADAQTLDTIAAKAFIIFDQNDTIPTNIHKNTIDALPPTSSISDLPDTSPDTEINLHYTGQDDTNGSGLKSYSIYVSDNDGPPELFVADFTRTDTVFRGMAGHLYKFYIIAKDTVNNIEQWKFVDSIRIVDGEQSICPGANTVFHSRMNDGTFQWQVNDGTGYVNIADGPIYSGTQTASLMLTAPPTHMYGHKYRCVQNGTIYSDEFILKFSMTWEGTLNTAWEVTGNWSCNVLPDEYTDVIINGGKANYPVINSHVVIRTLQMNPGATGTVGNGFTLTIRK